jgi:hypothetical protein
MNEGRRDRCGRRGTILNEPKVLVTRYVVRGRALAVSPAPDGCQSRGLKSNGTEMYASTPPHLF